MQGFSPLFAGLAMLPYSLGSSLASMPSRSFVFITAIRPLCLTISAFQLHGSLPIGRRESLILAVRNLPYAQALQCPPSVSVSLMPIAVVPIGLHLNRLTDCCRREYHAKPANLVSPACRHRLRHVVPRPVPNLLAGSTLN